ncbi:hypothetical protein QOZ80_7BG0611060 [Eleusine coracana subsp. coracana]|nr:hypothetical protein QOZ80_7BG0611060 [Eleusine coracana subsp. coracana]
MDRAMASLTEAVKSFLATPRSEASITRLQLKLYLVNNYSDIIGPFISQAIDSGTLKDLDLSIVDEKEPDDCYDEEMLQQARGLSAWKIHAPDSKLSFLELDFCCLGKLEELNLICGATRAHRGFNLSEVLRHTALVHNLTLNFQGEKLWIKPEGKQLCTAFSKLRKLSLRGIFVEFDLLWTIVLLEAVPSVEILDIEIWEHPCIVDNDDRRLTFGERTNPSWKVAEFRSQKEWLLKEVQVTGFSPMEQQIIFIRAVMQRASNLKTVVLKDHQSCRYCEEIGALPRSERLPAEWLFPKRKEEWDHAVEQLIRDISDRNVQIIFRN